MPSNGQSRGFLITNVVPALRANQRVLYLGDWDWCGHQIEDATRRTLNEYAFGAPKVNRLLRQWERVALTAEQVDAYDLPVISKLDRRYRPARSYDAVETEALGAGPHHRRATHQTGPADARIYRQRS
jgi:hypothetical protein